MSEVPLLVAPVAQVLFLFCCFITLKDVQRFRGGLVFKAHRLLHYSTLGSRSMKKELLSIQVARSLWETSFRLNTFW